jgi:hypothetical protein
MPLGTALGGADTPVFRWLVRLVAVSAVVLLPWAAYLALSHLYQTLLNKWAGRPAELPRTRAHVYASATQVEVNVEASPAPHCPLVHP